MGVPAAVAALPLLVGALTGLLTSDHAAAGFALSSAAGAVLALLSAAGAFSVDARPETTIAIATGCALAGASLGITSGRQTYHPPLLQWFESRPPSEASAPVRIEGVLREDPSMSGALPALVIDVHRVGGSASLGGSGRVRPLAALETRSSGGVRLSVAGALGPARLDQWRAGRSVRIMALLRLPSTYLDPGVRDDRRALARRGIILVGTVKSAALVDVAERGSTASELAAAIRAQVRVRLGDAVGRWSSKSAAIATAVLIGDRTGLPDADTRRLQDAGTYHVIAISGGNIAILTVLLMGALGLLRVPARAAAAATIVLLLVYGEVVVPASSVQRAISAALLYLGARLLDHRGSALNVLAVAAALGVGVAPVVLLDPGFILSFGATLGILVVSVGWTAGSATGTATARAHRRRSATGGWAPQGWGLSRALGSLGVLLWTTMAAEAALLPMAAVLFGRVTVAGLLLNFAAIPLMSLLQAASLVALAASIANTAAAAACGYVAHLAAAGIVESARLTDVFPGLARDVVTPEWWVITLYYMAALTAVLARTPRVTRAAGIVAAAAVAVMVVGPAWGVDVMLPPNEAGLRVVFLDVGQGDSTVVLLPGRRAILVDAGGVATAQSPESPESDTGSFDVGLRVVAPALRALGVRRLDAFTITHGDPDHIGGGPAILRAFRPPSIWDGVPVPPHPWLRAINTMADTLALHWRTVQAGDVDRIGPVLIRVLHPPLPDWERQRVRNEDSVVLDVRVGDVSIVLPGDIGAEGEKAILPRLQPSRIVVLKAPHHGSATSSTPGLLSALRPTAVIFSAGRNNRFGHPHPAVVARYRAMGAAMFSTAEDGAVILDTDGATVTLTGWTGRRLTLRLRQSNEPLQ
jgi:competence protein ComEC